ncbi:MbtH family protein [Humidisolicoccus flavus]|uniref:MbtH family protein n=1 Tax=Humidisolicoccus flavus TaxID=3111414 RepID=UPI00324ABB44
MTNPFDDSDANFRVLVNEATQHSLWPEFADIPQGWVSVFGPAIKEDCLEYVNAHWQDISPVYDRDLVAS